MPRGAQLRKDAAASGGSFELYCIMYRVVCICQSHPMVADGRLENSAATSLLLILIAFEIVLALFGVIGLWRLPRQK